MTPAAIPLAFTGALDALAPDARRLLIQRTASQDPAIATRVAAILARVRTDGDEALRQYAREYDRVELRALEVPRAAWDAALARTPASVRAALERAAGAIATAHRAQLPREVVVEVEPGVTVARRPEPLARIGVYAPGGRAAYPSSVLMGVVPARVAGVGEVIVCSPPGPDGIPSDAVLAAAAIAGATRVFALGGAGAIAALAFGTTSVPAVDRIVGPGNAYVAEAKRQLAGMVPIDSPAGPSELVVLVDAGSDPVIAACEMIAQAEHDPDACAVAFAVGDEAADALTAALAVAVPLAARREVVAQALARQGGVLRVATREAAIAAANAYAPEHLLVLLEGPDDALANLRNAGAIFLGPSSSVAFGDYRSGGNHVLPTGGAARAWSGLGVLDCMRWTSWQRITPEGAARIAADTARLADFEGLPGHAAAARTWEPRS
jgi:histidinol dehydrogenase